MKLKPVKDQKRLYRDISWLWPIISPPEDYIEETELFTKTIREYARIEVKTLLNLGCGGGHNDSTFKNHFHVTGVDISESMLSLAKQLNPEVRYIRGDMRNIRLENMYDAVVILDSINYMLTENDLKKAFETAFHHLVRGGVFFTLVEEKSESFKQNQTQCTIHKKDDMEITFIENIYDSNFEDTCYETMHVYLIRKKGQLEIETDHHVCGIFNIETWLRLLKMTGFQVRQNNFILPGIEKKGIPLLVCLKP